MLGHVAHPLEGRADAQCAHDDSQVACHRLLAGKNVDGQLVEGNRRFVDLVIVGDDGFSQGNIRFVERASGVVDRCLHQGGDFDEALLHLSQFLLEYLAHYCPFRCESSFPA